MVSTSGDLSLRRCGLKDKTVFLLESKKLRSSYDVLRLTALDLVQQLDVSLGEAREILAAVSSRVARRAERTQACWELTRAAECSACLAPNHPGSA